MFEVGKKYTNPRTSDIALVLFADERSAYLNWQWEGMRFHLDQQFFKADSWMEYKEPQKLIRYINIWKKPDGTLKDGGVMYLTEEEALAIPCGGDKRAGVAKLEFTESV